MKKFYINAAFLSVIFCLVSCRSTINGMQYLSDEKLYQAQYMARYMLNREDQVAYADLFHKIFIEKVESFASAHAYSKTASGNALWMVQEEPNEKKDSDWDGAYSIIGKVYLPQKIGNQFITDSNNATKIAIDHIKKRIIATLNATSATNLQVLLDSRKMTVFKFTVADPGAGPDEKYLFFMHSELRRSGQDPYRDYILGYRSAWESKQQNGWGIVIADDFIFTSDFVYPEINESKDMANIKNKIIANLATNDYGITLVVGINKDEHHIFAMNGTIYPFTGKDVDRFLGQPTDLYISKVEFERAQTAGEIQKQNKEVMTEAPDAIELMPSEKPTLTTAPNKSKSLTVEEIEKEFTRSPFSIEGLSEEEKQLFIDQGFPIEGYEHVIDEDDIVSSQPVDTETMKKKISLIEKIKGIDTPQNDK